MIIHKLNYRIISKALIAISFAILGLFSITFGQSVYQSKENVDNFDVKDATETIKDLQESIEDITDQLYALDNKEITSDGELSQKYREVREEIVSVIQDINKTTDYVGTMLQKIAVYKKQIFLSAKQLKDTRAGLDNTKIYIEQFANFLYKMDNELFYGDKLDDFKLFTKSDNIPLSLSNEYIIKSILIQFNELMENLDTDKDKQIKLIKTLNELKLKASKDVADYQVILETLHQKKNYLIQFMKLYRDDQLAEQNFNMIFDSRKDVHNAILSIVNSITQKDYNVTFDMEDKLTELDKIYEEKIENESDIQPMAWPMYPINDIEMYFGDENFEKEYGIPNRGLQIKAEQGTPLYSANDGIVYHVTDNPGIGINWILVVHPKGYVSAYMFVNKAVVEKGDIVRRGQLIGYSGGEPGTKGAGFISKGPNLTFFTFKDGIAVDPLQLLDLSVVEDKEIIPKDYNIKYLNDKYARTIDISELKIMTGNSVTERANQFINTYGVGIYRQLAFWEDAIKEKNVDRDVVICIAFAESTLGNYLSTSNNIGNVGNDDSGNRISFSSALAGARAISDTLNNRYLGKYHTIKQLSRYGNKDGKIYASSPINWQSNVTKCLSQIKGYYVPEDFPFRTGPNPRLLELEQETEE
ncbi:MAG TPA: peptidoglycan DD-metalloendopeptidase family protein [Candidatus Absconditabacterales bacterium]|nr:peptidoglycan DD-metalloendopeptidase family protein [Candidatus Absconditabacterales bacterium]